MKPNRRRPRGHAPRPWLILMNLLPDAWRTRAPEGMVENRPVLSFVSHVVLAIGIAIVALPLYVTFVASTHDGRGGAAARRCRCCRART